MSDYTPTTAEIRKGYIGEPADHFMDPLVGAEFDRWLAAHDREVWRAGYKDGNLDGYFGSRDAWREHGEDD